MLSRTFRTRLTPLFQRIPFLSHMVMLAFALLGPHHLPILFSAVLLAVHMMLITVNIRTIYGAYHAWRGVARHESTDWRLAYAKAPRPNDALMFDEVEHMIFCPNYAEDISVLRETLYLLSTQPLARTSYHPVLAMEAREKGAMQKADQLLAEFRSSFKDIGYTLHPDNIEGEAAGKSSNLAWAVRQAWHELKDDEDDARIARIIVTVIDSDTALAGEYFASISCKFALRTAYERSRMMFVPPICFDRNAYDVPVAVRITDIMWSLAGLSSIYPGSNAKIPTSAYSLSMILAANVGFHDAGPQAIGEDMHMFIKCLFSTGGNLISETIYSPASQFDVVAGERGGWRGLWNDHVARYKQAIRHMWGSLDTGYALSRLINGDFVTHPEDVSPFRQPFPTVFTAAASELRAITEDHSVQAQKYRRSFAEEDFATPSDSSVSSSSAASVISADDEETSDSSLSEVEESYPEKLRVLRELKLERRLRPFISLAARLYEAHLLMGHMMLLVVTRVVSILNKPPASTTPHLSYFPNVVAFSSSTAFLEWAYLLTDRMRNLSIVFSLIMFILYDRYHQQTVSERWRVSGGRLGVRPSDRSERLAPLSMLDFVAMPAGIIFGIVPLLQAQFMHLFTDRLVYTVSFKPKGKEQRRPDVEKGAMA